MFFLFFALGEESVFEVLPKADELDAAVRAVQTGDEAATITRLEAAIKSLRAAFKEVRGLAQGAEQAAAKCEVEKTNELSAAAYGKAVAVEEQAKAVVT